MDDIGTRTSREAAVPVPGTRAPNRLSPPSLLPAESPVQMPAQLLSRTPSTRHSFAVLPGNFALRRAFIVMASVIVTALGAYEMYEVLQIGGITVLEGMVLALYVLLLAWVALSFVSGLAGFMVLLFRGGDPIRLCDADTRQLPTGRTAMLLPTYNEDPSRVLGRLRAIHESVSETGASAQFDWFVLSDTTDPVTWVAEEAAWLSLRAETGGRIFYRHRSRNVGRKAGNIADWVQRFGGRYDFMIVLDADSLMAGDTILRLVGAMERQPHLALIQTLPVVVNARTTFARMQQFASRLYGPLIGAGIAWWHGPEGNYWGHNAIIRVRAFAEQAGLPQLPGRKPFGGHILSHDFVEAALMRRGGWSIVMAPLLSGSYEEVPPSLLDFAARDRRWCQGNLQHLGVIGARGLHWVSRLHLATGIAAYLTAPLWLLFLVLGILISLQAQFVRPDYFPKGFSLFPLWPSQDPVRAAWVFAGTLGLLLLPKLLGFLLVLTDGSLRRGFGGAARLSAGVIAEILLAGLIAPVMMLFQSAAVAAILAGRDAGWRVQRREGGALPMAELLRRYGSPTLTGVAMGASAWAVSLPLLFWMLPVIAGLVLAIPIAALTSRAAYDRPSGLFVTPEESRPPAVLVRANELARAADAGPADPAQQLRDHPELLAAHRAGLGARGWRRGEIAPVLALARAKIGEAETFAEAVSFLQPPELFAALDDPQTLDGLMDLP